jgi:hypothetical protein
MIDIDKLDFIEAHIAYRMIRGHIEESQKMWPPFTQKYLMKEYGINIREAARDSAQLRYMAACANEIREDVVERIKTKSKEIAVLSKEEKYNTRERFYMCDDGTFITASMAVKDNPYLNKYGTKAALLRFERDYKLIPREEWEKWLKKCKERVGEKSCGSVSQ